MGTSCMETAPAATTKTAPAAAAPTGVQGPAALYCLAAAAFSGALLWMCFQPLAWGTYLGWVALVPFLVLVRSQARPRFVYSAAIVCGLAFFVPALQWMRVADRAMVAGWIGLALYCALYFPAALYGIRCLERRRLPLIVSVPLVWVALEYFRCFALTGFPWYLLAHTQHDLLPMIQITDIGGVFLVTLVVAAVNAFLFDLAYQFPEVRQWFNLSELEPSRTYASLEFFNRGILAECLFRRNLILEGTALVILLASTYTYGAMRLSPDQFKPGPTVCLLQSNLDQRLREGNDDRSIQTATKHFADLCIRASFNHHPRPDLLIWPETSFPRPWVEVSPDLPIENVPNDWRDAEIDIRAALGDLAGKYTRIPHLLGMNAHRLDPPAHPGEIPRHRQYNSALLLNAQGRIDGKFDKIHRVPFGEYVPLKAWLPFLSWLTPYDGKEFGIQQGEKLTRFKLGKYHFGVLICYEDSDPSMARRYVEQAEEGPAVDFLVNMSNDGWFDGSSEHEEHLAVSRFRAIECRRAMVRAVNMGVSALIDGNGRVLKPKLHPDTNPPVWVVQEEMLRIPDLPISEWHQFKQKAGILKATVPIDTRFSFYAATGDWLPIGCWLVLLTGAAWSLARRRFTAKTA
jgi:apolipoprotein N-acyltransferase